MAESEKGTNSENEKGTNAISTRQPRLRLGAKGSKAAEEYAINRFQEGHEPMRIIDLANFFNQSEEKCKRWMERQRRKGSWFTIEEHQKRPQWYFPSVIKGEVYDWYGKEFKKGTIGVGGVNAPNTQSSSATTRARALPPLTEDQQVAIFQDIIETTVLGIDLLKTRQLQMHATQFVTDIPPYYYEQLNVPVSSETHRAKIVRRAVRHAINVAYTVYPNGTVVVSIENSKKPFPCETEEHYADFFAFLGEVRRELAHAINDPRQRAIPEVRLWYWTQAEFNKDIPIETWRIWVPYVYTVGTLGMLIKAYIKTLESAIVKRYEGHEAFKKQMLLEVKDQLLPHRRTERIEADVSEIKTELKALEGLLTQYLSKGNVPSLDSFALPDKKQKGTNHSDFPGIG